MKTQDTCPPTVDPSQALAVIKQALDQEPAPDYIWARIADRQGLPVTPSAPPARQRPRYWFVPPVAALALGTWMLMASNLPLVGGAVHGRPSVSVDATPFIALRSLQSAGFDAADTRMVTTEVPRTWLAASGVPIAPERAGDAVRIELLIDAAGEPLAFRIPEL
jgi:hypothetical protein